MARMQGADSRHVGLFGRIVFAITRRKMGKLVGQRVVLEPIRMHAHHSRLLFALGQMEMGQEAASTVDEPLKQLAGIRVAMLVGCPF